MDLPIVCTLTEAQLQERRREVLDEIRESAIAAFRITDGYSYQFEPRGDTLAQLARLVDLERQCCQFLSFKIVVEPGAPIVLEITGPPESLPLITEFFGC